jgi:hypothetical protein
VPLKQFTRPVILTQKSGKQKLRYLSVISESNDRETEIMPAKKVKRIPCLDISCIFLSLLSLIEVRKINIKITKITNGFTDVFAEAKYFS